MAWSWSHTAEAYAFAEAHCKGLDRGALEDAATDWMMRGYTDHNGEEFPAKTEDDAATLVASLPYDVLADFVWDRAYEYQTCDNGGWNAWLDYEGWVTVPFSPG